MSVALAHLVGAAVLGVLGPYVLDRLPQRWSPRVLITAWVSSIATAVGLLILSALSALWPDPPPAERFVDTLARCAGAVLHAVRDDFSQVYGIAVAVVVIAAVARTAMSCARHTRDVHRVHRLHRDVVAVVGSTEPDTPDVLWIDHPPPPWRTASAGAVVSLWQQVRCAQTCPPRRGPQYWRTSSPI